MLDNLFNFSNLDVLIAKSAEATKLEREKDQNKLKFTELFEQALMHPGVAAVVTLCKDEFIFKNEFTDPEIKLSKQYGIRNGQFISIKSASDVIEKTNEYDEEISEEGTSQQTSAEGGKQTVKKLKASYLAIEIMKETLNIEDVYTSWMKQIVEKGNELANN